MKFISYFFIFTLIFLYSCSSGNIKNENYKISDIRMQYSNVINMRGVPANNFPQTEHEFFPFVDMGAWHAHYLPTYEDSSVWGGFTGPLYIAEEYGVYLSKAFAILDLYADDEKIDLSKSKASFISIPGGLLQNYSLDNLDISEELIFINNRTSLIKVEITNKTGKNISLQVNIKGDINSYKNDSYLETIDNGVAVKFKGLREVWDYLTTTNEQFSLVTSYPSSSIINNNNYENKANEKIDVASYSNAVFYYAMIHTFNNDELNTAMNNLNKAFKEPIKLFIQNDARWNGYINKITKPNDNEYNIVSVKGLETLIVNWRSGAGSIPSDGITPALAVKWFNGFWPWDSWKQVAAATLFDEELAKANMRVLFDLQIQSNDTVRPQDAGMIIDAVFFNKDTYRGGDGGNWNERNSKPPLSAWAVWCIYEEHKDKAFVEEMYEKIKFYHEWWYRNRDYNKNGVAEYGATVHPLNNNEDEKILAAAWDSGMDNAPRFDRAGYGKDDIGVKTYDITNEKGEVIAHTVNQESVDLNSYLYAEKIYLSYMAELLVKNDEKEKFLKDAQVLKDYIVNNMFDEETGAFYDLQFDNNTTKLLVNRGKAAETYIPLWANVATEEQAKRVRDLIMDENVFNTYVPLPTVAKDNPSFAHEEYWRGPVWLDQSYFAIKGLRNYGYNDEADELTVKIFNNLEGLLNDVPINENYSPITGKPLNAPGFSWSSSMLILMHHDLNNTNK